MIRIVFERFGQIWVKKLRVAIMGTIFQSVLRLLNTKISIRCKSIALELGRSNWRMHGVCLNIHRHTFTPYLLLFLHNHSKRSCSNNFLSLFQVSASCFKFFLLMNVDDAKVLCKDRNDIM